MSKHRDKRVLRRITELEEDILQLNEENSQLRLLIEEQQELIIDLLKTKSESEQKEFKIIREQIRGLKMMDNHLFDKIHNEEGVRRDQYHRLRRDTADALVDLDKIRLSKVGKWLLRL